jgi:hypothetical protein
MKWATYDKVVEWCRRGLDEKDKISALVSTLRIIIAKCNMDGIDWFGN